MGLGHHTAAPDSDQKNLGRNKETWDLGNAVGQQTDERQQQEQKGAWEDGGDGERRRADEPVYLNQADRQQQQKQRGAK